MKYQTHNEKNIDAKGTHGRGGVTATYEQLVELFGKPMDKTGDYKTDAEWVLEYENGVIVTIYNWKNGKNYLGDEGFDVEEIDNWNVGGNTSDAQACVDRTIASGEKPTASILTLLPHHVQQKIDERIDDLVNDRLFTFMQDILRKVYKGETRRWIEGIKRQGVSEHLELKQKEEGQATEQVNQEVMV